MVRRYYNKSGGENGVPSEGHKIHGFSVTTIRIRLRLCQPARPLLLGRMQQEVSNLNVLINYAYRLECYNGCNKAYFPELGCTE